MAWHPRVLDITSRVGLLVFYVAPILVRLTSGVCDITYPIFDVTSRVSDVMSRAFDVTSRVFDVTSRVFQWWWLMEITGLAFLPNATLNLETSSFLTTGKWGDWLLRMWLTFSENPIIHCVLFVSLATRTRLTAKTQRTMGLSRGLVRSLVLCLPVCLFVCLFISVCLINFLSVISTVTVPLTLYVLLV